MCLHNKNEIAWLLLLVTTLSLIDGRPESVSVRDHYFLTTNKKGRREYTTKTLRPSYGVGVGVESKGRPVKRRWLANAKLPTRLRLGEL
jgi:hypothetical protein